MRYLDAQELDVAGVPCLALRIGFVGELGYELHCAASAGEHLWDALVGAGRGAVRRSRPQRVLRLEKAHVIVGQDTDSESNLLSAGMPWIVKADKADFVGKWAVEHVRRRGPRERLVGFTMQAALPLEGAQVVRDGRVAGRVTSARVSERLGQVIGLAWVEPERAVEDEPIDDPRRRPARAARVTLAPFYDPEGALLRS